MRISNPLHFTENHRFYVTRDFSLSSLDYKMLSHVYQPMIGAFAVGLYHLLYQQIPADKIGSSLLEQQRKIFLSLDMEPNEQGRKRLIEQTSKLEAIGLLQTSRLVVPDMDEVIFEYRLFQPLGPHEFFENQHLVMLLKDKIGKYSLLFLQEELHSPLPPELQGRSVDAENLSVPFYDIFRLSPRTIDHELETALSELAAGRQGFEHWKQSRMNIGQGFDYADIAARFPQSSANRAYVEHLKYKPDAMAKINFIAQKYNLTLLELCRLLDEDGVFGEDGNVNDEVLQYKANLMYRQDLKRKEQRERFLQKMYRDPHDEAQPAEKPVDPAYYLEVPSLLQGLCDQAQYNFLLRNQPYTKVLEWFFSENIPDHVLNLCEKIFFHYKVNEEVLNVLIHYLHTQPNSSWMKKYVESIVADLIAKKIQTYEQAVLYFKEQANIRSKRAAAQQSRAAKGSGRQKGKVSPPSETRGQPVSEEEIQKILLKAKKLGQDA